MEVNVIDPQEWLRQYKASSSCAADTVASLPATHIQSNTEDRPVLDEFTITDEYALAHLNMHNCMSCGQPYECNHTDANPRRHWIHFGERFGLCGECSTLNNQEFVN